jgi:hypothetical protein
VEYTVLAEVAPALIAVVVSSVVSVRLVPPAMFTTASSMVPALFSAMTTKRDCTALTVPSVAEDGTTKLAGVPVTVVTAPLVKDAERKSKVSAEAEMVNALAATDAEMGWISGYTAMVPVAAGSETV